MNLIIAVPKSTQPCFFTKDLSDPEAQKYLGDLQMKYGVEYRLLRMDLERVFRQLHNLGVKVPSVILPSEPSPTSPCSTTPEPPPPATGA